MKMSPRALMSAMLLMLGSFVSFTAQAVYVDTPEEAEAAFANLTPEQEAALAEMLGGLLGNVDFSAALKPFLPDPEAKSAVNSLLGGLSTRVNLALPSAVVALLPSELTYRWETEVNGHRQSFDAVLNVPTLLDVDGDARPDVNAMLSISGPTSVTMTVDRIGAGLLSNGNLPLKIEAIVSDPRAGSSDTFALGYDTRQSQAPDSFSEQITIGGGLSSTELTVNITTSGAGNSLTLLAEQFRYAGNGSRNSAQTIAMGMSPVPTSTNIAVSIGNDVTLSVGASPRTTADITYVDFGGSQPQTVEASIDQLPTNLSMTLTDANGDRKLTYTATQTINEIDLTADELTGFGNANRLELLLGGVPTSMTLSFGQSGDFDLNLGNANLGLMEALLTNGPSVAVPNGYDGVTMQELPGTSVLTARINGLKRVSGQQSPLSIFLDSVANRPFRVELREQPHGGAKQTYTLATLHNLQRNTRISVKDGSKQEITYRSDAAASSLSFETNAGNRHLMTASASPVARSIDLCATGNNACSTSGKAANTGSFRIIASQHMTMNMRDCDNSACSDELKITNLNLRRLDAAINITRNCPWYGCWEHGSKGSIWLDTDNYTLTGRLYSKTSSFKVDANFGSGFKTNNRYVSWSYFVPSKSGSISCGSGTFLKVTVFGITIDIKGLYLC